MAGREIVNVAREHVSVCATTGAPIERREPLDHPGGFGEITTLRITLPGREPISRAARAVHEACPVSFVAGDDNPAEIEFDHGNPSGSADFRPALPLRFRW